MKGHELNQKLKLNFYLGLFGIFALQMCILLSIAKGKNFWLDESFSFSQMQNQNFSTIWQGLARQSSPMPLDYVLQKLFWIFLGANLGDLRVTLRVVPALAFLFSLVFLSVYVGRIFSPLWGLLANVFYFANAFLLVYSVESRPYSMWCALSLLHLICLHSILRGSRRCLFFSLILSFLILLTASGGLLQVGAFSAVLAYLSLRATEKEEKLRYLKFSILGILIGSTVFYFYISKIDHNWGLAPPTIADYKTAIAANIYAAFRLPRFIVWIFSPLVLLWWPLKHNGNRVIFGIALYGWILFLGTVPFFFLAMKNGLFVTARHYIFLQPFLSSFLLLALAFLLKEKRTLAVVYCCFLSFSAIRIYENLQFSEISFPSFHRWPSNEICLRFPEDPDLFNKMNLYCSTH